jgi:predicted kinase
MNKMFILIGVSGSGKSTEAKRLMKEHSHTIIVSRDSIRSALWGLEDHQHKDYYNSKDISYREELVTDVINGILDSATCADRNVIIDATNLKISYLKPLIGNINFDPHIFLMKTSVDQCLERDMYRDRCVGGKVIRKQQKQLESLLGNLEFKQLYSKYGI